MDQVGRNGRVTPLPSVVPPSKNLRCLWLVDGEGRRRILSKATSEKSVFISQFGWVQLFHPPPAVHRENLVLCWVAPGLPRKFEKQFYFWPSQTSPSSPPEHAI